MIAGLLIGLLLFAGCSVVVDQDQTRRDLGSLASLTSDTPVGQTFVARHGGLNGIEVWLAPVKEGDGSSIDQGTIILHLRSDPEVSTDLRQATLASDLIQTPGYYLFDFEPLPTSHSGYYYAFLEVVGDGRFETAAAPGDAYLNGAMYVAHDPRDAQLAFKLTYDPLQAAFDVGRASLQGLGLLGAALLLYAVPGWALLAWLWPGNRRSFVERLALSIGVSLAIYPVLIFWTWLLRLNLGPFYVILPVALGLVALVLRYRLWLLEPKRLLASFHRGKSLWERIDGSDLTVVALLVLIFATRLLPVRTLSAPMWADSYHHTMITQLIIDHGGLFSSWLPYAELEGLTYHFGFHAQMAALHWLTGLSTRMTVLWGAQLLNVFAVLALVPMAFRIGQSRWSSALAILVGGLLSPNPMYYVNWGRYTQLAGQAILPVALWLSVSVFEETQLRGWHLVVPWITVGGLALTHFRVLIFYLVFVVAWVLFNVGRYSVRGVVVRVLSVGIVAALIFLPWFGMAMGGKILEHFRGHLTRLPTERPESEIEYNTMGPLDSYLSPWLWVLSFASIGLALWRQNRSAGTVILWWGLLLLATNPDWLRLPGSGVISNFALFIAVYIPVSLLIAGVVGWWLKPGVIHRQSGLGFALLIFIIGSLGASKRLADVEPWHALVVHPDVRAADWIEQTTPPDAKFWVNSYLGYGESVILGSDGGWWLPLLANRSTTLPPMIYGVERVPYPGYRLEVKELTLLYRDLGVSAPETVDELVSRGVTHVYIGQRQGALRAYPDSSTIFDPEAFVASPCYGQAYHRDRVWIFELIPTCEPR